jgi:membrane protein required for colicin V production
VTIFDYLVLFILISSVLISTLRGLVKEILSLVGWVAAFVVANAFGAKLAPMLPSVIPGETVKLIVAFIALFLGVRVLMGSAACSAWAGALSSCWPASYCAG